MSPAEETLAQALLRAFRPDFAEREATARQLAELLLDAVSAALPLTRHEPSETALAARSTAKAYELRNHASDRERFFIALSYDLQVTGNLEKARRTGALWGQTYPRAREAHAFLSMPPPVAA